MLKSLDATHTTPANHAGHHRSQITPAVYVACTVQASLAKFNNVLTLPHSAPPSTALAAYIKVVGLKRCKISNVMSAKGVLSLAASVDEDVGDRRGACNSESGVAARPMSRPSEKLRVDNVASVTPSRRREMQGISVIACVVMSLLLRRTYAVPYGKIVVTNVIARKVAFMA